MTALVRAGALQPPAFPPGVDVRLRLRELRHSALDPDLNGRRKGRAKRVELARRDPLLFALIYFSEWLRDEETGLMSFSTLHLALINEAWTWRQPGPHRSVWAAPREAAKSLWTLILCMWALACGHRRYLLYLSLTKEQAATQIADVAEALSGDSQLVYDFPHLSLRRGTGSRNTRYEKVTAGSRERPPVTIRIAGMTDAILGLRGRKGARPGIIVLDDAQPGGGQYTPSGKAKLLRRLTDEVLPLNLRAVVIIIGTVTMRGCLIDDAVRVMNGKQGVLEDLGAWVREHEFRPYHFPAIQADGRSMWEQKWPTPRLHRMRQLAPRPFALNYMVDGSDPAASRYWGDNSFRYGRFPSSHRVLSIDGALTSKPTSDFTAVALVAYAPDRSRTCAEAFQMGRWTWPQLCQVIAEMYRRCLPGTLRSILVEINGGHDMWERDLRPHVPPDVELVPYLAEGPKRWRAERLCDEYDAGRVLHATKFPALEAQMISWDPNDPKAKDDGIDAVGGAVRDCLYATPGRAPAIPARRWA